MVASVGKKLSGRPKDDADKLRPDVAETAYRTVQAAIGEGERPVPPSERTEAEKNPEAVARGRKGGKKGGKARKHSLSAERRSEIAQRAARQRWDKKRDNEQPETTP